MTYPRYLVIMAGGASSRMKKSLDQNKMDQTVWMMAQDHHKCLIPLGQRKLPLLYYQLRQAKRVGVIKVCIVTPEENSGFVDFLTKREIKEAFGTLTIELIKQTLPKGATKPMGTADAILQAMDQVSELRENPFVVFNGDNLYSITSLNALYTTSIQQNALIGYDREGLDFPAERIQKFAVLQTSQNFFLTNIIEKPSTEMMNMVKGINTIARVSMNIFKFYGPSIYPYLKNCPVHPTRKEKELPAVVQQFVDDNEEGFLLLPLCEHVPDLTDANDIEQMIESLQ